MNLVVLMCPKKAHTMPRFNDLQIQKMAEHEARQIISNPYSYTPNERMIALHTAQGLNEIDSSMEIGNIELY